MQEFDATTVMIVLVVCGAIAAAVAEWARWLIGQAELVKACADRIGHRLYLDAANGWNATVRCEACPFQRPATDAERERGHA